MLYTRRLASHLAHSSTAASSEDTAVAAAAASDGNASSSSSSTNEKWLRELRTLLLKHEHAGVGECGLDKVRRREVALVVQQEVSCAAILCHYCVDTSFIGNHCTRA
jgi:Tat protein secretion system quality control protein TatD with DNase activity